MNHLHTAFTMSYFIRGNVKKLILLFFIAAIISTNVLAQNYTLTSNGDTPAASPTTSPLDAGGQITLRSAMQAATQIAGAHIITIPASITTINLSLGTITVGNAASGNNITLNGPGKAVLTINQTTVNRIFSTGLGAVTFVMNDLTLNYAGPAGTISGGGGAIVAGGVGSVNTFTNVAFTNFNIQSGNGGALLVSTGNVHTCTLTNCDFTNNLAGSAGGAFSYNGLGTCTIINCRFTNNRTGPVGASLGSVGGAIYCTGNSTGGTYNITRCTFTGNQTLNNTAGIGGGAISCANGITTVNYCRFVNNTAANAASGNTIYQSGGGTVGFQNTNADNNWWGVNTGPGVNALAVAGTPAGVITSTKWLQLKASVSPVSFCTGSAGTVTASFLSNSASEPISTANLNTVIGQPVSFVNPVLGVLSAAQPVIQASGTATVTYTAGITGGTGSVNAVVDNVPNNDATATASPTIVAPPAISANPVASTLCAGLAASFTATATNQTSVVWQESATAGFGSPTTLSNTGIYSGALSNTLTISDNTSVNGRYYRLVASNGNGCGTTATTGALLTATTPSLSANNSVTQAVNTFNNNYYAASCAAICKIVPSGASPVTGNVTSQVWVEGTVPTVAGAPFVQRHYQVTPATAAATATATVTLYFSQAEFDNFNANPGSALNLPTGPADAAGKANLRIGKYTGSSGNGTGLPASYPAGGVVLDPVDASIVWNAGFSRWEVSVDVAGFSGFIVQTNTFVLPVKLVSFTARLNNNNMAELKWQIAQPEDGSSFELQRSITGRDFIPINTQQGDFSKYLFSYTDASLITGRYYYRLQITSNNGKITFSDIVFVTAGSNVQQITLYPNPVKKGENISVSLQNITAQKIEVTAVTGQVIWSNTSNRTGSFAISLPAAATAGVYLLKIYTNDRVEIRKVMIE